MQGAEQKSNDTAVSQQLFALIRPHLLEQLRRVFDVAESRMLRDGVRSAQCCEIRRYRRNFIDSFLAQWQRCCEDPAAKWHVGSAATAAHARTAIYLTGADTHVQHLLSTQVNDVGRIAALWSQQTGWQGEALVCPLSPHTLTRLFFLLLPDLPATLALRCQIADEFLTALPAMLRQLQHVFFTALQRRGVLVASVPAWPEGAYRPLQAVKVPAARVTAAPVAAETLRRICEAALDGDCARVACLLREADTQIPFLAWLLGALDENSPLPKPARHLLVLLTGPLLQQVDDPAFVDSAHPARRVLEELLHWLQGWQVQLGVDGVVPEQCLDIAVSMARDVLLERQQGTASWQALFDYLLRLRKRVQQDTSAAVASARLSLQVVEVRAEVDALLRERAALEYWPAVVVELLQQAWTALMMQIHWREGSASDSWLHALTVADQLLASAQLGLPVEVRQAVMRQVPQLLQGLRRGLDQAGCERARCAHLLSRLESVHLALLQDKPLETWPEPLMLWPALDLLPEEAEPFEVGQWLRLDSGAVQAVLFSDEWCTVLLDTHSAEPVCYATADLQDDFCAGKLESVSSLPLLQVV